MAKIKGSTITTIKKQLKEILNSPEFHNDMKEMSDYAANIKQERPIMMFLAKHFWKNGFSVILEKKKVDLVINKITMEAKFDYESDVIKIGKEMDNANWDINKMMNNKSTWGVTYSILKDLFEKNPDIFLLIISSRNLMSLDSEILQNICWAQYELPYNVKYGFNNNKTFAILDKFWQQLNEKKKINVDHVKVDVNQSFDLTYHFYIVTKPMNA